MCPEEFPPVVVVVAVVAVGVVGVVGVVVVVVVYLLKLVQSFGAPFLPSRCALLSQVYTQRLLCAEFRPSCPVYRT